MADHLRKQIRDAAIGASVLGNLATTGSRVYESRTHELQDANVPGLRVYTNNEQVAMADGAGGATRTSMRTLDLVVECCSKKSSGMDDELDAMIKEVEVALAANQGLGGAKWVQLRSIEIDMEGEAEKEIGVARMTFEVVYFAALSTPDTAQ